RRLRAVSQRGSDGHAGRRAPKPAPRSRRRSLGESKHVARARRSGFGAERAVAPARRYGRRGSGRRPFASYQSTTRKAGRPHPNSSFGTPERSRPDGDPDALALTRPGPRAKRRAPATARHDGRNGTRLTPEPPRAHTSRIGGLQALGGDMEGALERARVPAYALDSFGIVRWVKPAAKRVV